VLSSCNNKPVIIYLEEEKKGKKEKEKGVHYGWARVG
jgi:hypothetical protein